MLSTIFYLNEQGKRQKLEDCIYPNPGNATQDDILFMVCDGVGGHSKGEEASRIACEAMSTFFRDESWREEAFDVTMEKAVRYAISEMREFVVRHPDAGEMSTTLALACLQPSGVAVAWCGDSRIYHIREGEVLWKSRDHSFVQHLVDLGEITPEEASHHPRRNVISRSINPRGDASATDTAFIHDIQPGDYLLLCSDGLLENIDEEALRAILGPGQQVDDKRQLMLHYCDGITKDNFSMYLLQFGTRNKSGTLSRKWIFGVLALVLIILFLLWI